MTTDRPMNKNERYMNISRIISRNSTCLRRHYGATIVKNDMVISTGYNGSPRGEINCNENLKGCVRDQLNIPHGERYEECVAVHAEANAIINAGRERTYGADLYLYGYDTKSGEISAEPCKMCARLIKQAGIKNIISLSKDLASIQVTELKY